MTGGGVAAPLMLISAGCVTAALLFRSRGGAAPNAKDCVLPLPPVAALENGRGSGVCGGACTVVGELGVSVGVCAPLLPAAALVSAAAVGCGACGSACGAVGASSMVGIVAVCAVGDDDAPGEALLAV